MPVWDNRKVNDLVYKCVMMRICFSHHELESTIKGLATMIAELTIFNAGNRSQFTIQHNKLAIKSVATDWALEKNALATTVHQVNCSCFSSS